MRTTTRNVMLGLAMVTAALAWSLPASAQRTTARALIVKVIAGKPTEFGFKLTTKTFKHGVVTFKLTNLGMLPHDFKVCASNKGGKANACAGKKTAVISKGGASSVKITFLKAGSYEYLCTVPGHAAAGMKGLLKVT